LRFELKPALAVCLVLILDVTGCSGNRSVVPELQTTPNFHGMRVNRSSALRALAVQPPALMQMAFLMTDGTVLTQSGVDAQKWYRYTPDARGDYSDGTWSAVGTLPSGYAPSAYASAVLADGRLAIVGGEYNAGSKYGLSLVNLGAIYDPVKQSWTPLAHPDGWNWIGDSPSSVLPDGRLLVGDKLQTWDAYLDPATLKWTNVSDAGKADWNAEEGWTLLADGTVFTADVRNAPNAEIYNPANGRWASAGSTMVDLHSPTPDKRCSRYGPSPADCYMPAGEIGPAMLRPDGTVFCTGSYSGFGKGAGHTAIYHSTGSNKGKWAVGPDFPNGDNAGDSFAVLEPSGNVLVFGDSGALYEWNGTTLTQVPGVSGVGFPILLPTGQVMMLASSAVVLYTPAGSPQPGWAPSIKSYPHAIAAGKTYKIAGTQFNGLSQALAFGDELQNATNYPLVRITSAGNVYYARTHNHSTMGVATGSKLVWTYFDVPAKLASGSATLQVVANGIASKPVNVTIAN